MDKEKPPRRVVFIIAKAIAKRDGYVTRESIAQSNIP